MEYVLNFIYFYPITMAFVWMVGTLLFQLYRDKAPASPPEPGPDAPMVSVLIPCHNEEDCIEETIRYLSLQTYSSFEIIAIDDASSDRTCEILRRLQGEIPNLRVIKLKSNQGKGTGLNMAALHSRGEYLVCIDADALLDKDAIRWFMWHFKSSPRVGAVTGNPKVRNRTSILAKIQVGEYSTIIGMIKRAQRIIGKVYTVSGVVVALRKKALLSAGFWSNNMVTEDIDISWKLQLDHWDIRYEARALCWILVPETLSGIWKQRVRWSQGGSEVLLKYARSMLQLKNRRIWPVFLEYAMSTVWCYCLAGTAVVWLLGYFIELPLEWRVRSLIPAWTGVLLSGVCLMQLCVGLAVDSKYDKTLLRLVPWLIWYPALYWVVNCLVTVYSFPKAVFKRRSALAVWESPDRGI